MSGAAVGVYAKTYKDTAVVSNSVEANITSAKKVHTQFMGWSPD
jgi:hypothetical protein